MKPEALRSAVLLGSKLGHVFVATSDSKGQPHLAVAGSLSEVDERHVSVTDWFCDGTMSNLQINKCVAIVVWDREKDTGYQLLGRSVKTHAVAMMDGYAPSLDRQKPPPQVEREILVRIDKIVDFRHALHSDEEE